jgi:hypoxanthine phosphoribosyltransferase
MEIPANYKMLFSKQQIDRRVTEIAKEISAWAKKSKEETGEEILCLPVMCGAIFFFSDLVRALDCSVEITPVSARSYCNKNTNQGHVELDLNDVKVQGRNVLLVDDICDSGRTLEVLKATLEAEGANEIRSAVLVERTKSKEIFQPDYIGFDHSGPEWFVGYGMDDNGFNRNLPQIYTKFPGA